MTFTPAIFRVDLNGNPFALLPADPADHRDHCTCYRHTGGRTAADYGFAMAQSHPATPAEAGELTVTLEAVGYTVRPVYRASRKMHEARRKELKRMDERAKEKRT